MSLTKEALQHLEANAITAAAKAIQFTDGSEIIALPVGVTLHNLEPFKAHRDRFRARLVTHSLPDFIKYVSTHVAEDVVAGGFVDQDAMSAIVIFNLGNQDEAGHGDDTARLTLKPTAAYSALKAILGREQGQQSLAEWLEDWAPNLQAFAGEEPLNIAAAINGIRKMTITAKAERGSVVGDMSSSRSAMDEIEAKSQETLATSFIFTTAPFEGLQPAHISLRLSVITGAQAPILKLRWVGEEAQQEAFAVEFKQVLEKEVGGLVPLTIGTFSIGN